MMTTLGKPAARSKAPSEPGIQFEGKRYRLNHPYRWEDLPSVTKKDALAQQDDFEAHFGRGARDLLYRLLLIPRADVVKMLEARFGEGLFQKMRAPEIRKLAESMKKDGLQYPPIVNEGVNRALAAASLGWDLPYFDAIEPFEVEGPTFIPTLEGRRRSTT